MKMSKGQVFRFGFVKGRFLATAVLALSTSFLAAFELDLKGSIKNVEGEELNEVEVIILGSKLTASSDSEGNFQVSGELTDPELLKNIELVFKKEGYLTKHRSLAKSEFEALSVRMMPSAGSVTDIDGNSYQTVSIGKQEWTVRNLWLACSH